VAYARGPDGDYHVHSLQVFSVAAGAVRHNVVFADPAAFAPFGLAARLAGGS
jgi:RNA polymerase sigma-70 factor, ECF subfamily